MTIDNDLGRNATKQYYYGLWVGKLIVPKISILYRPYHLDPWSMTLHEYTHKKQNRNCLIVGI